MPSTMTVFVAVAIYISVGVIEQSALPAFLAHAEIIASPNATKDDIERAVTSHMGVCRAWSGALAVAVAGWAGRLSDRFGRRPMAFFPALGQAVAMAGMAVGPGGP